MTSWQEEIYKAVHSDFEKKKSKNPRYSIRQYAKKVGVSVGAMSEILRGKRRLTPGRSLLLLEQLDLTQEEHRRLRLLMGSASPTSSDQNSLNEHLSHLSCDWKSLLLLALSEQNLSFTELANRSGIPENRLEKEIAALREQGLWPISNFQLNWELMRTTSTKPITDRTSAFRENQIELLCRASKEIESKNFEMYSMLFSISTDQTEEFLESLRSLLHRLSASRKPSASTEIFQVSLQAFPLTPLAQSVK